jgi:hypothetical protein
MTTALNNNTENLRRLLTELNAEGETVVTRQRLSEVWTTRDMGDKGRLSDAIKTLRRRGELKPEGGTLRWYPQLRPEPRYVKIYRALRASAGPVSIEDLTRLAECQPGRVDKVIRSLVIAGYAEVVGRAKSGGRICRATALCRNRPEPPPLNYSEVDFARERRAVARLVELLMLADPKRGPAAQAVREQLEVLNNRFALKGDSNDS